MRMDNGIQVIWPSSNQLGGQRERRRRSRSEEEEGLTSEFFALKQESRILRQSSKPVSGFSMMEQVSLCAVWPMENLAWLFLEPHTGLDHCLNILQSCFRKMMSVLPSPLFLWSPVWPGLQVAVPDTACKGDFSNGTFVTLTLKYFPKPLHCVMNQTNQMVSL